MSAHRSFTALRGWRRYSALTGQLILVTSLALASAQASEPRHGLAFFGDLKYPPDFTHFDYVNPAAPKTGAIRLPQLGNFDTLNPFIRKGRKAAGADYNAAWFYERLMFTADDEPSSQYGWLAETAQMADDFSWVRFRLRPEARWHDGTPVTAHDVLFTYEQIAAHGSPGLKVQFRSVTEATVEDDRTMLFRFRDATSPKYAQTVANMYVAPAHDFTGREFNQTSLRIPLGSGPYRVSSVEPGRKITYELIDDYWGRDIPVNKGRYNMRRIVYDYFSDENVIHEAHKAGIVDARLEGVAKRWANEYNFPGYRHGLFIKNLIKTERPHGMNLAVVFNMRRTKFQDVRVREALALVYDFEWSNRVLYHGFYARVDSYFENSDMSADGLPDARELALLEPWREQVPDRVFTTPYAPSQTSGYGYARRNLLRASALLDAAGWVIRDGVRVNAETGEPFTIEFVVVSIYLERGLMPYANALKRLGITSSIRTVEVSQYINRVGKFDFEGTVRTYAVTLTPGVELRNYWGTRAADRDFSLNNGGVRDPAVDALIEKILSARSRVDLVAATRALDRVMLWNFYAIPGFFPPGYRYGYWDKFERPAEQARFRSGFFDTWWYDEKKATAVEEGMKRINAAASD